MDLKRLHYWGAAALVLQGRTANGYKTSRIWSVPETSQSVDKNSDVDNF